ncbi:MAG: hypothetical protein M3Y64_07190, partial [Gemmatimonadota bacterium]|nr:hypothetical protein [Gemmatimonadota bacterium]
SATQWNRAVTLAQSRMSQYTSGAPADVASTADVLLTRTPWHPGLDVVTISVAVAGSKRYELRRVVPNVARGASRAVR